MLREKQPPRSARPCWRSLAIRCRRFAIGLLCPPVLASLVFASVAVGTVASAWAEPVLLSNAGVPRKVGFNYSTWMEAVPGNGYQTVYLQFTPTAQTFSRDRNLTIEITPSDSIGTQIDFVYRDTFQLPQQGTSARSVHHIPYYYPWDNMRVRILEDGRVVPGSDSRPMLQDTRRQPLEHCNVGVILSGQTDQLLQQTVESQRKSQASFRRLSSRLAARAAVPCPTVSSAAVNLVVALPAETQRMPPALERPEPQAWQICPDVRSLLAAFDGPIPDDPDVLRLEHADAKRMLQETQSAEVQFRLLDIDDMQASWLAHSQLDAILVPAPLLEALQSQPQPYRALTDWLAAGGNLWVYAVSKANCELLQKVPLAPLPTSAVQTGSSLKNSLRLQDTNRDYEWEYNAWNGPNKSFGGSRRGGGQRKNAFEALKLTEHPFVFDDPGKAITGAVRQGRFGLGTVTAIDLEDPFPQSYQFWNAIVRATGEEQLDWTLRMGMSVPEGSTQYWSLLIGSVGQPPVKSFIGLNTLFVLAIGPVCYLYLRQRQRLYLLFFVAPLFALLITSSLIVYALLADGISTRVRTRHITWVDPQADYAVTQGRQTYFAVLDSRDGLVFPHDAAVYPVCRGTARQGYRYNRDGNPKGSITNLAEGQVFQGCFLPPRSQVQMLAMHPQQNDQGLAFEISQGGVAVTNHFPFGLQQIQLRDAAGVQWRGQAIAAGTRGELTRIGVGEVAPLNVKPLAGNTNPNLQNSGDPWGRYVVGGRKTLLENTMDRWLLSLPRERFIAIADQPYEATVGIENAERTEQSHIVMGRLP